MDERNDTLVPIYNLREAGSVPGRLTEVVALRAAAGPSANMDNAMGMQAETGAGLS